LSPGYSLDLVALVPGKDDEQTLRGLFERTESLRISRPTFRILRHPRRDPGCYSEAEALLQAFQSQASHALVMFDHEGSGQEERAPDEIASGVRERLIRSGWDDRCSVLVIAPELEAWVWSDSPHVDEALGWAGREPRLREWLLQKGMWPAQQAKPQRPKSALEAAMQEAHRQRSSAIYYQLAKSVGLERCSDPSFRQLVRLLRLWFPQQGCIT